jgi:hypothetical protein
MLFKKSVKMLDRVIAHSGAMLIFSEIFIQEQTHIIDGLK